MSARSAAARPAATNVVAFPKPKVISRSTVLTDLQEKEAKGGLRGFMSFAQDADGNLTYAVTGAFADRLQLASYVLVQALSNINDRIFKAGDAGHTYSPGVDEQVPRR